MSSLPGQTLQMSVDVRGCDRILAPKPFDGLGRRLRALRVEGARVEREICADNAGQNAYLIRTEADEAHLDYAFEPSPNEGLPDWVWTPPVGSIGWPSVELRDLVNGMVRGLAPDAIESALMAHVAEVFAYAHAEARFTDGHAAVPPLSCGLTPGSCVDIHTYAVAALIAAGRRAAYLAGVFVREGQDSAEDMHCWLAIAAGAAPRQWDISHSLIASARPAPGLGAIPGSRQLLSSGRGLVFSQGLEAGVQLSHFALPARANSGAELPTVCWLGEAA